MMTFRSIAVIGLILLATWARANSSMGLALEMFDFKAWAVYVVATLAFEAWYIGRRGLKLSWGRSISVSIISNLLSSLLCVCGCFAPVLHHTYVGSDVNPNPFLNLLMLLSVLGAVSAFIEAVVWSRFIPKLANEEGENRTRMNDW